MSSFLDTPFLRSCRELHAWRLTWQKEHPFVLINRRMYLLSEEFIHLTEAVNRTAGSMSELGYRPNKREPVIN